jgi:hypothetical protein
MSGASAHQRLGRSTGQLLILLAALGGLFAMHGLSDHGTAGPAELAASSVMSPASMPAAMLEPDSHVNVHLDSPASPSRPGHDDMGLAGLCLAVLLAGLVIGAVLTRRQHRALAVWLPRSHVGLPGFSPERVPKPPDLLALSVKRC